jgi:hypothetical protein
VTRPLFGLPCRLHPPCPPMPDCQPTELGRGNLVKAPTGPLGPAAVCLGIPRRLTLAHALVANCNDRWLQGPN